MELVINHMKIERWPSPFQRSLRLQNVVYLSSEQVKRLLGRAVVGVVDGGGGAGVLELLGGSRRWGGTSPGSVVPELPAAAAVLGPCRTRCRRSGTPPPVYH